MTFIRAQVSIPCWTLLPEHAITNTWHFSTVGPLNDLVAGDVVLALSNFYQAVDIYLSPVLQGPAQVKLYDITAPEGPYPPYGEDWGFTIVEGGPSNGLAEEVACCLSFHPTSPGPRRRGRVYLGPLASTAVTPGSATAFSQFATVFLTAIGSAATALITETATEACPWSVYSKTNHLMHEVVGGFIDNSPDTQRRRGHGATARSEFS